MSAKEQLAKAVREFQVWADAEFPTHRGGEWEMDYLEWESLYEAANAVLETDFDKWDDETKRLLLYTIAKDNEVGLLAENLTEKQVDLFAAHSLKVNERDAKWQLAEQLLRLPLTLEREQMLLEYTRDADEYVRRRALTVLAELGSTRAEELAFAAWETGEEYQRMACLHALFRVGSAAVTRYLDLAEQDGPEYLRGLSVRIRNREGEYAR